MKNVIFFLFLLGISMFAQKQQLFKDPSALKESFTIGTCDFYESIYRKNGSQPLKKGQDTVSFPYPVGVKMDVVGGRFWVAQKAGTVFVRENEKVIKRYDCANNISGFMKLEFPISEKKEMPQKSIAEAKMEFNYYDNSINTIIFNENKNPEPQKRKKGAGFKPFSFQNLAWEIPLAVLIVWGIIELIKSKSPHQNIPAPPIKLSGGGTIGAN